MYYKYKYKTNFTSYDHNILILNYFIIFLKMNTDTVIASNFSVTEILGFLHVTSILNTVHNEKE